MYKVFRMSGSGFPTENTEKKISTEDTEEKIMFIGDGSINFIPENLWKVTYILPPSIIFSNSSSEEIKITSGRESSHKAVP